MKALVLRELRLMLAQVALLHCCESDELWVVAVGYGFLGDDPEEEEKADPARPGPEVPPDRLFLETRERV